MTACCITTPFRMCHGNRNVWPVKWKYIFPIPKRSHLQVRIYKRRTFGCDTCWTIDPTKRALLPKVILSLAFPFDAKSASCSITVYIFIAGPQNPAPVFLYRSRNQALTSSVVSRDRSSAVTIPPYALYLWFSY